MSPRIVSERKLIRTLASACLAMSGCASALTFAQTFFVPLSDTDLKASWQAIGTGTTIGSNIKSVISIAVPKPSTVIYYDQWEDGYDADPSAPAGATTLIWGDGNTSNGTAPGYPSDIIPAGGVIVLNNTVTLPRVATGIFYDGRDRISSTNAIAVARVGWPLDPGPLIGTSAEAYDTRKFGTSFQMPVGTLTGAYQQFEYTSIHIMAAQDGTVVQVDTNADGTADQTQTLNMGQTMFVNGGVSVGATVTSSKPVEVHEVTGDIGSNYESRTFAVRPTAQWSSGYFAPVTTTVAAQPHVVYLYNPGVRAISVSYEGLSTTGTITVPSKGNATFNMPLNSAVHFFTVTGEPFYAVGANDAGGTSTNDNQSQDWGYALMPDTSLTTSIIAPFAPGADDTAAPLGTPDANGSPVWVTPTSTTTVYVNYSGDRATGPNTATDGSKYDVSYLVPKLGLQKIYNPTTFDMSKSLIFTIDSTGLAGGWGEDPATAGTALPYLDMGYAIIPFSAPIFSKFAALSTDVNANGVIDTGDSVLFTLFLNNDGVTSLVNPAFTDALPAGTVYLANSTVLNGVPVPDNTTGTAFPLDGAGISPPDLAPGASATVKFRVTISSGTKKVTNIALANSTSVAAPMQASVTFPISPVSITGNVYNDANGLTDGIVNGTATNAGATLYANIVGDGVVQQVYLVDADGSFRFFNMPGNSSYTVVLSTTRGTVGSAPPTASLPAGYANTGENLGLGVANDGSVDGSLSFTVATSNVANANFGIERIPTAAATSTSSQANPGGTTRVAAPTLSGTDPEDASVTTFIINTLPSNGTLYYNGVTVTAGQTLTSYSAALLKFDPNDGAFNATFTYSAVDAAGKSSSPATATMPFTSVSLSGTVYDDANGTTNNTVDGTGSNAGGTLYVNLVTGGNVAQVQAVAADGTFAFLTVPAAAYTLVLSTTQGTVGSTAPAASLPGDYVNTAEKLGTGTGSDGTTDGILSVTVASTSISNALFGFDRLPSAINVTAASQANPGGTSKVAVPTIGGTDPEDASITTVVLNTLATGGTLYYNNTATTAGQVITAFNSTLLKIDPGDSTSSTVVASFTYSVKDAAGLLSPVATVTMPFVGSGISIFGNVFNDDNGLTDGIVNGTGTNGGGLYAILTSGGVVRQSVALGATGAYAFPSVTSNTSYTVSLSTSAGTVNGTPPSVTLPTGYVSTGEFIGTTTGNDGTVNGSLAVAVTTATVSNANFGIDRTPTATALTATMANPGGATQVSVPTLVGTDPEDGSLSKFVINTLPGNGTLYYNGTAVTAGQIIIGFIPNLLKLDPNDGAITVSFTYSTVDAAGKASPAVSNAITFTSIGISGTVFDDANGLTDSIVNGTGTNLTGALYANLISGGNVAQVTAVTSNGTYAFGTVATNSSYTVVLSTTQGTVGGAAPAAVLPMGYVNTGEFIGTAAGNDGLANGSLIVTTVTIATTNANFGIEALPSAVPISASSQVNPAGSNQVTVPTLIGTDPEDTSVTRFSILSLPTNGTLYYNGSAVTVGQAITGYTASLLKFDPIDGALTATFNYAAVDAAGRASSAAVVTMPFTTIGITGIVFNDANGLTDGIVNGTGTNGGNTLYANLVSGGNVVQVQDVQLAGTYNFLTVVANTTYTVVISTTQGVVGSAAPAPALPAGYVNTGEFIGTTTGNDNAADGSLSVVVTSASVANANFGIEQPPATSDVTAASQLNPAGTNRVTVPALTGTDPEDVSISSFKINTLPGNGTLYYNGTAVTAGQTITGYNAALLKIDPNDGALTATFTYSAIDAAGKFSSTATVTMPFSTIGISGNVYNDANGLLGNPLNTVDGSAYSVTTLYANLVTGGTVSQVTAVTAGAYTFGTVAPNTSYTVVISTMQGVAGGVAPAVALPSGYVNTGENVGSGAGSDGTPDGILAVSVGTSSILNANFGVRQQGIVTGHLYIDTNGNGAQGAGEPDLANVDVLIADSFGATRTVTTNFSGNWSVSVPPGTTIADVQESDPQYPTGYTQTQGNDPTSVTAVAGNTVDGGTDGYFLPGAIAGLVLADTDNDHLGDAPISGVTLTLLDAFGNPVDGNSATPGVQPVTTITAPNGSYGFANLPPGIYGVAENQPSGYFSVSDSDGGNPNEVRPVTVSAGSTNAGNNFIEVCPGSISGFVRAGSTPLAGVTLVLLDSNGNPVDGDANTPGVQPITALTDSSGHYIFSGVLPGDYCVAQSQPAGYDSVGDLDGGDVNVIGDITRIRVVAGQENPSNNFVEIRDTCPDTWVEWKSLHPGENSEGNPDGDRYDNLAEFAFAMPVDSGAGNPLLGNTAWIIRPSTASPGTLEGVFVRPKGAWQNVTYSVEYVDSLANPILWAPVEIIPAMATVVDNGDCTETVTIHDLETLTGLPDGKGFVRIRADLDENGDETIDHTSYTEVEGWKETGLDVCCRTYANPFLRETVFTGTVGGVGGQTINLASGAGAGNLSALIASGPCYVEITSGVNEGHRFDVVSAAATSLTLAVDTNLFANSPPYNTKPGALPADLTNSGFVLRRHWTLAELFPPSGFGATDDPASADQVQLFAEGQWIIYWLYDDGTSAPRWVKTGDNTYADQGGAVLAPGQGMFFNNRHTATSILAYGEVRENAFVRPLAAGSNLIAGGYPIDQSPAEREMTVAKGFFGSRDIATADSIFVWKGDATAGESGYTTYFLNNNAPRVPSIIKWARIGDPTLLSRDAETILSGNRSVFFRSKNGLNGCTAPRPWDP